MRRTVLIIWLGAIASAPLTAQAPGGSVAAGRRGQGIVEGRAGEATTLRLTVDDAVKMALEHNVDLAADRLEPHIGEARVAASAGAFVPVFSTSLHRNNELDPPANLLAPIATRTRAVTSQVGLSQTLPWFGTSYSVAWDAVHTRSNSFLNSFNPILESGLSVDVSQPIVRDLAIDPARRQLATSRLERDIAETRTRESVVHTTARVKSAYWNLASAIANVSARKAALDLAQELVRVNKVKVDVGQSPQLDLVSARAEVAANQEQLIIAETRVKEVEDQLRTLIFDTSDLSTWKVTIDPVDLPPLGLEALDLDAAVANALKSRADLVRGHKDIDRARVDTRFARNQRLPDVRLNASYRANGLGGTQVLRTGEFPGAVIGTGSVTDFASVLNQVFTGRYSTWVAGVSVTYPIGQATEDADYARAKLEQRQAEQRLKGAESRAVQQVRDAWWNLGMNSRRIETTRAVRELAEQRLNDERRRFEVGISTSFLVIQAQRDLAQARTNELAAILAYDLALVDFEALQQAGPTDVAPQAADAAVIPR